ncbi:MAG TPA: Maf family protein [Polyangiaceae bacterium]
MRIDADHPLVLGSASPRRREMIAMLGVPFVVCTADIDESTRDGETPQAYLERIARAKLEAVRGRVAAPGAGETAGILVADTVVIAPDGGLLGKPADDDEARVMVQRLGGATHEVSTRFLLAASAGTAPPLHAQTVTTRVTFRAVDPGEVNAYAATGEGRDKAGAYAVQGRASAFVERIEGSYSGVVGLPLCEVVVALRAVGWL